MSTTETRQFPCSNCGASLSFAPGEDALTCDRCGSRESVPEAAEAVEYDLRSALADAPKVDPRSMGESTTEVRCEGCGAITILSGQADRCAFCDSPVVVFEDDTTILKPESVLPFKVVQKQAAESFRTWIGSRWFAPSDLQARAQQDAIDGVYLPYWTFDSASRATYRGEIGTHYHVEEPTTDADGNASTRRVRKTDWQPTSGRVRREFDDVLVCATESLPQTLTQALEPWDLDDLRPFDPSFLAGFQAERYGIDLEPGWEIAQTRIEQRLRRDAEDDIGGDEQKVHDLDVRHDDVRFKHTLLPLWISSYRYNGEVYRVIVNARTGAISGNRPYSTVKLALMVAAILALLFFLCGGLSCCSGTVSAS